MGHKETQQKKTEALLQVGRIASVMVDGDVSTRVITDRAMHYITRPDPKYRFLSADFYDVDHQNFLIIKKTLLRLQRLLPFYSSTSFWLRFEKEEVIPVVLNNEMQRYYQFGWATPFPMNDEMKQCCFEDKVVQSPEHSDFITVLAPVKDSLQDVVGFVEITTWNPASDNHPPPWS